MKKFIPFALALLSIAIFLGLIVKNERHLNNSQSMYVRLQPVDPRSLIQGDYMRLNYALYFAPQHVASENTVQTDTNPDVVNSEDQLFSGQYFDELIKNKSSVVTYVELDPQRRVVHSYFEQPNNVTTERLVLQNPNNRHNGLYPASRSFLFAEGLADCYQQAVYAEFKVDQQGNAILTALKGEQLQDLGCESKQSWSSAVNTTQT